MSGVVAGETPRDSGELVEHSQVDVSRSGDEGVGIVSPSTWVGWDCGPTTVRAWLLAVGFAGLCGVVALRTAAGRPDWVAGWRITAAFLGFAGILFLGRYLAGGGATEPRWLLPVQLGLTGFLLYAVFQSATPGIDIGFGQLPDTILVIYALVGLVVFADDPRRYSAVHWAILGCFAIFTVIFFGHSVGISPDSPLSRHPLWGAMLLGLWLVVFPRHLPSGLVFWGFSRVAAVVTVLGLAVYVWGPYELYGLQFRFHGSYTIPVIEYEYRAIRSMFVNRNSYAIVVFGGFVSALIEYFRRARGGQSFVRMLVPSALVVITGVGYFAAFGRALWVVGLIPLLVYFAYLDFGRVSVPVTTVLSVGYLAGGIVALAYAVGQGYVPGPESDRYGNWAGSIAAIRNNPSLFGEGLISPTEFIQPYRNGGSGPHNAYLSTWIRFGVVGISVYGGLIVLAVAHGVRRFRTVDVGALALALGFAAHKLFESYTMFSWEFGGAATALALGFVAFGEWQWRDESRRALPV